MHFPETCFALNTERLGVFGWEVEILGPWHRSTKLFDKLLIPPKRTTRTRVRIIARKIGRRNLYSCEKAIIFRGKEKSHLLVK